MSPIVETLNFYLALDGILGFLLAVILIIDLYRERALVNVVKKYGLYVAFLVATGASTMALIYSDVFGFDPCGFCWLERVFLFPQVVLLLTAIYFKDQLIARYGLPLSLIGFVISLYHHYLQMGGNAFVKCPASGTVDCAKRIMFEFDFMTFPLLAAAGFAFLSALYFYILKTR
jgi:disulfide bond formation protein DsbB